MLSLSLLYLAAGASAGTCNNIAGNYYCDQTSLVKFNNVGFNGEYNRVTSFNDDGTCSYSPQSFSGSLSPFDEELSVHFRGPIQLETFQVYTKGSNQKRQLQHRHADPEPAYAVVSQFFTTTVMAGAESPAETSPAAAAPTTSSAPADTPSSEPSTTHGPYNYNFNHEDETSNTGPSVITTSPTTWSSSSSSSSSAPATTSSSGSGGSWSQIANYDASSSSSDGLVFLNNLGGSGSGVWSASFGNSLSYAGSDGVSCASSPQTLEHTTIGSNKEFAIFSDNKCEGDDCGYYRPGTVAHHGFGGSEKIFIFEFSMPSDGSSGFNADMPAVWLLNAQIPRNLQYGDDSCSCWKSGCGELDLWEVLNGGNDRMIATLHDKQNGGGGSSDYFQRPTSGTFKGAVVFDGTSITVLEIDEIPSSIDEGTVEKWVNKSGAQVSL